MSNPHGEELPHRARMARSGEERFAIMRVAKIKTKGAMAASLQHTFRERETLNADEERTHENEVFLGGENSAEVLQEWNEQAPDKIRKNAVHALEYFIGASPEKMAAMNRNDQDNYFQDALDWVIKRHGGHNVLSAVVHRDETTPHMSIMVIPKDERGKLNARKFLGGRQELSDLQTEFAETVGHKNGMERGKIRSKAHHLSMKLYYTNLNKTRDQLLEQNKFGLDILDAFKYTRDELARSVFDDIRENTANIRQSLSKEDYYLILKDNAFINPPKPSLEKPEHKPVEAPQTPTRGFRP